VLYTRIELVIALRNGDSAGHSARLCRGDTFRAYHPNSAAIILFGLGDVLILSSRHIELELTHRLPEAFHEATVCRRTLIVAAMFIFFFIQLPLFPCHLLLLSQRAFTGTRNLSSRRKAGLGEALLGRKVLVLDK
jgi:hypothetical protein